jgi:hypothetical protein
MSFTEISRGKTNIIFFQNLWCSYHIMSSAYLNVYHSYVHAHTYVLCKHADGCCYSTMCLIHTAYTTLVALVYQLVEIQQSYLLSLQLTAYSLFLCAHICCCLSAHWHTHTHTHTHTIETTVTMCWSLMTVVLSSQTLVWAEQLVRLQTALQLRAHSLVVH